MRATTRSMPQSARGSLRPTRPRRPGALSDWESSAAGALALLLVLDQFPRNMFRNDARAYAADPLARAVAERAIGRGFDQRVDAGERVFFYLPFEHSEEMADQARCIALHRALGDADSLKWAELHADIIARFGRFPHRNGVLSRETTPDEQAFSGRRWIYGLIIIVQKDHSLRNDQTVSAASSATFSCS